jgi:hypothetical protein
MAAAPVTAASAVRPCTLGGENGALHPRAELSALPIGT